MSDQQQDQIFLGEDIPASVKSFWPELADTFDYVGKIAEGKTGATFKVRLKDTETYLCLKTIADKITEKDERKRARDNLSKEVEILKPLLHNCLPQIFKSNAALSTPYYVCTFHPGQTLKDFLQSEQRLTVEQSFHFITALVDVLEFLHNNGRTHCDLHSGNIMVSQNVIQHGVLVIDFGSGHRQSATDKLTPDRGNKLYKGTGALKKHDKLISRRESFDDFREYDFKALGHLIHEAGDHLLSDGIQSQKFRLNELCHRLSQGNFRDWAEVRERMQWIIDPDRLLTEIRRLCSSIDGEVRRIPLPVYRSIPVGDAILAVVNTKVFQRLRGIHQLSFCEWIYPGANHTRFEHSLGVFNCVRKAINSLLEQEDFSDNYSIAQIKGCLLAALLHDIGHYPFAHAVEQYAYGRFATDSAIRKSVNHATFTLEALKTDDELKTAIERNWGDAALHHATEMLSGQKSVLADLIDGPIDCDKCDYLKRDSLHSGLHYGEGLDLELLVRNLVPAASFTELGIRAEGIGAVTGLMMLQDQMLNQVYWHHNIRGIMCMFHAALAHLVKTDGEVLQRLVMDLRSCRNNFEAMQRVVLTANTIKKDVDITPLLNLHQTASFKDIYVPVVTYRPSDRLRRDYSSTMHDYILKKVLAPYTNSMTPIQWKNVSRLRKAFVAAINMAAGLKTNDRGFVKPTDVIVDVPVGKTSHKVLKVLTEDRQEIDLPQISFVSPSIFSNPTAFAPIRVYVNPQLYEKMKSKWHDISTSAETRLLKASVSTDEDDEGY